MQLPSLSLLNFEREVLLDVSIITNILLVPRILIFISRLNCTCCEIPAGTVQKFLKYIFFIYFKILCLKDLTPEPEPSIQTPNVVGGSYVPPHMRGGAPAAAEPARKPVPRGRMRPAPDINSEVYFPSLSSASEDGGPKGAWGKTSRGTGDGGHFEEVRERGNQNISRQTEAPKLSLENKFSALRDGD